MKRLFEIRQATIEDIPLIFSFIKELAEYQKLLNKVVATEAILRESLFGDKSYAEVIISMLDGHPVGFALYFHNFSTFLGKPGIYVEDLFVRDEVRGQGIGKKMLAYLAQLAKQKNCGQLEWCVLGSNEAAIAFYKKLGAKLEDEWVVYRLGGEQLDQLAGA